MNPDRPNGNTLAQQRCGKYRPKADLLLVGLGLRKLSFKLCCKVMDMNELPVDHGAAIDGTAADGDSPVAGNRTCAYRPIRSRYSKQFAVDTKDICVGRTAQSCCIFDNYIQHRLNVRRRACDHPENFARRSLLLQRLFKLVE